jgi:hypothetical protein
MQSLGITLRIIFQYFKDPLTLSTHLLIKNGEIITILISSIY